MDKKDLQIRVDALENGAKELQKEATELRELLRKEEKITDPISNAISYLGEEDEEVIEYRKMEKAGIAKHYLSEQKIVMYCKAINEKKPLNSTTYTPWFDKTKKPGAGFCHSYDAWSLVDVAGVSFRLRFNDRDHAIEAGQILEQEYYNYLMKN